jgi:hypothetical protein
MLVSNATLPLELELNLHLKFRWFYDKPKIWIFKASNIKISFQ